jgi:hypothetical protein
VTVALKEYEKQVTPFVRKAQSLIPGVPGIANPQTAWGIKVFYTVLWAGSYISRLSIAGWLSKLFAPFTGFTSKEIQLPSYPMMKI